MISKKILVYTGAVFALIIGLANSGQHPVTSNSGYTNAPGDSVCSQCHSGNSNFDGEITISGLPSTIMTGNTYNITVTVTNPNGNADKAGFQLLALNGTNANAGNLTNNMPSANTSIRMVSGGKKYFGHLNAMNFPASNELSYTVDWTAPSTTGSNPVIKFYAAAVIANGNGQTNLDRVATTSLQIPIQGPATGVSASITNVKNILCAGANTGSALAVASGGTSPYGYNWSNGVMVAQNNTLPAGTATVTITDAAGTTATASTTITAPPVLNASASSSPACSGGNNGSAFASGSGGSGTLSYFCSNNVAGQSNNNLFTGTYTVTVTDSNGCTKSSTTTVTSLPALTVATSATATTCGNNNGSITTSVANVGFNGYLYVGNGSGKGLWRVSVHRCVAEAFLPNPNSLPEVAHLNGDKRDNRAENLKWVSGAENQAHRTAHGTDNRGSRHGAAKLNEALVKALREKKLSPRTVSNMTGAGYKHVQAVAQGKDWPHVRH